jgi:hypothetical protein
MIGTMKNTYIKSNIGNLVCNIILRCLIYFEQITISYLIIILIIEKINYTTILSLGSIVCRKKFLNWTVFYYTTILSLGSIVCRKKFLNWTVFYQL